MGISLTSYRNAVIKEHYFSLYSCYFLLLFMSLNIIEEKELHSSYTKKTAKEEGAL